MKTRFSEWLLIPRNHVCFKRIKKLNQYTKHFRYQLIDFYWRPEDFDLHLPLSLTFHPNTFDMKYHVGLNKKKKIIICGEWQELKYYYHFLKFHGYHVYLLKK